MYGEDVDITAFLQRALIARVATNGPTVRPLWYLYEEPTFYWLTDTANMLHRVVMAGEKLALVVDTCDLQACEVIQVSPRGRADVIPVDRGRAMRKFARYLGPDPAVVGPAFRSVARCADHADVPLHAVVHRSSGCLVLRASARDRLTGLD